MSVSVYKTLMDDVSGSLFLNVTITQKHDSISDVKPIMLDQDFGSIC